MVAVDMASMPNEVIFGAAGVQEIVQNVRTLLLTRRGTVPLDREFGLSFEYLDSPIPRARARLEQEIWLAIKKYESRAILKHIKFEHDVMSGKMYPHVSIDVKL
jgi:phage baseplate assembly protein W